MNQTRSVASSQLSESGQTHRHGSSSLLTHHVSLSFRALSLSLNSIIQPIIIYEVAGIRAPGVDAVLWNLLNMKEWHLPSAELKLYGKEALAVTGLSLSDRG